MGRASLRMVEKNVDASHRWQIMERNCQGKGLDKGTVQRAFYAEKAYSGGAELPQL